MAAPATKPEGIDSDPRVTKRRVAAKRSAANEMARKILEKTPTPSDLSDHDVESVLNLWAFRKNSDRKNVTPQNQPWVYSDTFGLVKTRTGKWMMSQITEDYPHVPELLNAWLGAHVDAWSPNAWRHTSITINTGFASARHRDRNNAGPSLIRAFGDHSGGSLLYWPTDQCSRGVEHLSYADATLLDIKAEGCLRCYDGTKAHEVEQYSGARSSIIFFMARGSEGIALQQRQRLRDIGFRPPKNGKEVLTACQILEDDSVPDIARMQDASPSAAVGAVISPRGATYRTKPRKIQNHTKAR